VKRRTSQRGIVGFPLLLALLGASVLGLAGFALLGERDKFENVGGLRDARAEVNHALLGFIGAYRRLPCPDTDVPRDGFEDCVSGIQAAGAVPFATLGLSGRSSLHMTYAAYNGSTSLDLTGTAVGGNLVEVEFPDEMPVTPADPPEETLPTAPAAPEAVETSAQQKAKIDAEYDVQAFYADLLTNSAVADIDTNVGGLEVVANRQGTSYPNSIYTHLESGAAIGSDTYDFTNGKAEYDGVEDVVAGAMRFLSANLALGQVKTLAIDLNDLSGTVQTILNSADNNATKLGQLASAKTQWQSYVTTLTGTITTYNARSLSAISGFQPLGFVANVPAVLGEVEALYKLAADDLQSYDYSACGDSPLPSCPTGSSAVSQADITDLANATDPLTLGRGLLKALAHTAEQASKRAQKLKETASAARGDTYKTKLETIATTATNAVDSGVAGSPAAKKATAVLEIDGAMALLSMTDYANEDGSLTAAAIADLNDMLVDAQAAVPVYQNRITNYQDQYDAAVAVGDDYNANLALINLGIVQRGLNSTLSKIARIEDIFTANDVVVGANTLLAIYSVLAPKLDNLRLDWYCRATSGSSCVADAALQYYLDRSLAAVGGAVPGASAESATAQFGAATQPTAPDPEASRAPVSNPGSMSPVAPTNEVNLADFCGKLDWIDAAGTPSLRIDSSTGAQTIAYLLVDHGANLELDSLNKLSSNGGKFAAVDRAQSTSYDDKTHPVTTEYLRRSLGCTALIANFRSFNALVDDIDLLYTDAVNVRDEAEEAVVGAAIDLVLAGARLAVDIGAIIQEAAGGAIATTICIASLGFAANFCAAAGFEFAAAAAHGATVAGDVVNVAAAALALADAVDGRNGSRETVNEIRAHYQDVVDAVKAADARGGLTEAN